MTTDTLETTPGDIDVAPQPDRQEVGGRHRSHRLNAGVALAGLAVAACSTDETDELLITEGQKPTSEAEAARFLLHAGMAVTGDNLSAVQDQGYERWLSREMNAPVALKGTEWLTRQGYDEVNEENYFFSRSIGDNALWQQLMTRENGVRKRAALALSEFFVVGLSALNYDWRSQSIVHYWDTLNEHAFGTYRELLEAVSLHPAMGFYLNTKGNRKADPKSGREPDENYSREVMQLFSIGLFQLNMDGTPKLDGSGNPIETYTNDDVVGLARVFTGYDLDYSGLDYKLRPGSTNHKVYDPAYAQRPMTTDVTKWRWPARSSQHSDLEKAFLGTVIPAGTGPEESLRIALDTLANHPNTAPFFASQMIQRLVTSNPSPAYVARVANVFADNGQGVRGDLKAVFKAVLLDEEALSQQTLASPTFGKMREPMLTLAQWAQTFDAVSETKRYKVGDLSNASNRLGQSPMRSPSVFNFFRPGFIPPNSNASANDLYAPEFALLNESSIATGINFMMSVIEGRQWATGDIKVSYAEELELATDPQALLDRLDLRLTANQLSSEARGIILGALQSRNVDAASSDTDKLRLVHTAVMLIMAAPEYVVQK